MRAPDDSTAPHLPAPDFSLRQLSYFVATAQHESVHRASEALHVSPPAISAAIAHLEQQLGLKLFRRRHARGMVPTEAGRAFAAEAQRLLAQAWAIGGGRLGGAKAVRGWVHVGCLLSFAPFLVPPLVRAFRERHPRVRVFWHEGTHESLLEGLRDGALEMAVTYDFEVPGGIACRPLRPAPLQAVLPAGHRLARRTRVGIRALAKEPFVLLDLPRTREYMLSAFAAAGLEPRIEHRAQSLTMLRGLVASGLGCSLLNFCPPYAYPEVGALVTRPLDSPLRTPNMVVAHAQDYRPDGAAGALVDCIAEHVATLAFACPRG